MDIKYILKEANYYKKLEGLSRPIKKFLLSQTVLSKWVNGPEYNRIYYNRIRKKSKKHYPKILQVENTNFCNARCLMCPHNKMKRRGKIMNLEDFKKIVKSVLKEYKIERLVITGFGEPFIDKGIIEKIKFVNKNFPELKIDIYTNASVLNKSLTDTLLKTKISRITFSVNGTEKNYKKIMGLDYQNTKKNLLYFLHKKIESENKVLTNISLMILKENEKDIQRFIGFWRPLTDSVRVYAPSNWAGGKGNIIQQSPFKDKKRWACFALWNNITIDVDGNMVLCCRDYESAGNFGNVLKQNIKEIRQSERFQKLLKKQLNSDFNSPVCKNCDNSFDSSLDWIC